MKVAFVGTFGLRPKATVGTRAIPLAEALTERGHDVTVIVPPWDNPPDSGKQMRFGKVRVLNVTLPPRIPLLWYLVLTWRLAWQTFSLRPDVVHVFKPKAFAGLVASIVWLLKILNVTNVRLIVDTDDWEGAGGWNEIGAYSRAQRLFFPLQEKWVLRQADAVTVASRELEAMVSKLRRDGKGVFYLPNAARPRPGLRQARPEDSLRASLGLSDSRVILLYTRFFEFGVSRALDVLGHVVERIPEARLLVVGKGFFGEEKELDALAQQRGLAPYVVQAGWVDEESLPAYFATANVAIYPFDDTLVNRTKCSMKLLELLDAGVPVVADRVGQNAEYIQDGVSGALVEPGDSRRMAEAVSRLMAQPELAASFGQQAQRRVEAEFSWRVWAAQAERAYEYAGRRTSRLRQVVGWLLVALWMGLIFYMSSQPSPPRLPEPLLHTIAAKLLHVGEYAVLALLLLRAQRSSGALPGTHSRAIAIAALLSVLYAISDEFHQSFVPNRHPSPFDVLIDALGASLALGLTWRSVLQNRLPQKPPLR